MRAINVLGLRVAGITAVLLLMLFGLYWGGKYVFQKDKVPVAEQVFTDEERGADSDGDGVADLYETTYYGTDPAVADTDGDGVSDLDEILAGRDPLVPGPTDAIKPATGQAVAQQDTYTQRYLASLPNNIPREQILDQVRLEAFMQANRGQLLPTVAPESIQTVNSEGKEAVSAYLDTVSSVHNLSLKAITSADIEAAFRLQVDSSQPQPMRDVVIALTNNVGVLENAVAPQEVVGLHTKFIAASQALRDNAKLLSTIDGDFVGGLIGAKNIEELGTVFQEIAQEMQALEEKYGIE